MPDVTSPPPPLAPVALSSPLSGHLCGRLRLAPEPQALTAIGRVEEATQHLTRAVAIADEVELSHPFVAESLSELAKLAAQAGNVDRARHLQERTDLIHEQVGAAGSGSTTSSMPHTLLRITRHDDD